MTAAESPPPAQLARTVLAGRAVSPAEALGLLQLSGDQRYELLHWAQRICLARLGRQVRCCSIASARTGRCPEDCRFCAQSARYRTPAQPRVAPPEELLAAGDAARAQGAHCFGLVASGPAAADHEIDRLAPVIRHLAGRGGLECCASLGCLTAAQAGRLRALGVLRYNHNLETSRRFFGHVVTTHSYDDRLATLRQARQAGLKLCSGGIINLGETLQDRVDLALSLRELDVDTVTINFLNPIPGTPLADRPSLPPLTALQTVAMFRFVLPDKHIMIAGGREKCLRDLQSWMFYAGASGCILGHYLTTPGRPAAADLQMLRDLELL